MRHYELTKCILLSVFLFYFTQKPVPRINRDNRDRQSHLCIKECLGSTKEKKSASNQIWEKLTLLIIEPVSGIWCSDFKFMFFSQVSHQKAWITLIVIIKYC